MDTLYLARLVYIAMRLGQCLLCCVLMFPRSGNHGEILFSVVRVSYAVYNFVTMLVPFRRVVSAQHHLTLYSAKVTIVPHRII